MHCPYQERCSGCDWLHVPYSEQAKKKCDHLRETWRHSFGEDLPVSLQFHSVAEHGLRDRVDWMLQDGGKPYAFGLYAAGTREILDLNECGQMSAGLQNWMQDFRRLRWPVQKGSVRLRVGPAGQRGVWLDFANLDVKALLSEKKTLSTLMQMAFVEIGQKRKVLVERDGELRLADPSLQPWFQTRLVDSDVDLLCSIGSFTQPSLKANLQLVESVRHLVGATNCKRVLEFGSGIGNFTIPLAGDGYSVLALELEELSCQALTANLERYKLQEHVQIERGNFHQESRRWSGQDHDLILVDPPRSGLQGFITALNQQAPNARHFIYVSCFPDSFVQDAKRLAEFGWTLSSVQILDQFPQSHHYELIAGLEKL